MGKGCKNEKNDKLFSIANYFAFLITWTIMYIKKSDRQTNIDKFRVTAHVYYRIIKSVFCKSVAY